MFEDRATVNITYDEGKLLQIPKGSSLEQLLQKLPPRRHPALAARVNGALQELDYPLYIDSRVEFLDYDSGPGWRIYRRSLVMLLNMACQELFPERRLWVSHSLSQGLFCNFRDQQSCSSREVSALARRMQDYIQRDLPIHRRQLSREDAILYMEEKGNYEQAELLKQRQEKDLLLHSLGGQEESFFGRTVTHSGLLGYFELLPYEDGFILRLPEREYLGVKPQKQLIPGQLHATLRSYDQWSRLMGISSIADLNRVVRGKPQDFIRLMLVAETLYERQLSQTTDRILQDFPRIRLLLLAGPSSSGKTTSTERLGIQFRTMGVEPILISTDDFFIDRDSTPMNARGRRDFEGLAALNLPLFRESMQALLAGEEVLLPIYDFKQGKSIPDHHSLRLEKDQILLVEGIHALNPQLSRGIPQGQLRKIFISALTQINLDAYCPLSSSDNRLLRRMVRDMQFRGIDPGNTLERWDDVRRGEHENIFPYQEAADFFINSSLIYELPVLRPLVEDALAAIPSQHSCYGEAQRLLRLVRYFECAPSELVPRNSILQEFIGNSLFSA
ncbi:MAG: nucleoside kinase [Bacillota bacterium]|nr:nucleoside kinase [Bacillota bacterium]